MRQFGLIGYPLSHSFSAKYFAKKFADENIADARYDAFPLEKVDGFEALCEQQSNLVGLNVTIPHKETIIPFLDELDDAAKAIGAVNTIHFTEGKTIGYNTDILGFQDSLKPFLKSRHERALILGTGGAAKAVNYVLQQLGIETWLVSRHPSGERQMHYHDINVHVLAACKLIVNTTPLGTHPNVSEAPDLPYSLLGADHLLYDLVYNPEQTQFMKNGQSSGAVAMNGFDMLKRQAEASWEIWNQ